MRQRGKKDQKEKVSISTDDGAGAKTWLRLTKRGNKEYMRSRIKKHVTEKQDKRKEREKLWDTLVFLSRYSLSLSLPFPSFILCTRFWIILFVLSLIFPARQPQRDNEWDMKGIYRESFTPEPKRAILGEEGHALCFSFIVNPLGKDFSFSSTSLLRLTCYFDGKGMYELCPCDCVYDSIRDHEIRSHGDLPSLSCLTFLLHRTSLSFLKFLLR